MNTKVSKISLGRKFKTLKQFCACFGVKTTPQKSLFRLTPDETLSVVYLHANSVSESGWRNTVINIRSPKTGVVCEGAYIIWRNNNLDKVASEKKRYCSETNHFYAFLLKDDTQKLCKFMGVYVYEPYEKDKNGLRWRRVSKVLQLWSDEDNIPVKICDTNHTFLDIA